MALKVAVVTGANKGIGFAIVKNLCEQFEGIVYLTARDVNRGKNAVADLNKLGLKPEFHQLDIDDENSISAFANFIKGKHGGLDVLVNNAGIAFKTNATEPIGFQAEITLKTNFFSLINVCNILFPLLRPHARVVNISSVCGFLQQIPGDNFKKKLASTDLQLSELVHLMNDFIESAKKGDHAAKGWPNSTYVVSKVGVSALTRIQHREFLADSREDLVINHVHPGYVDTDMSSHKGPLTPEQGADAPTYLALLPKGTTSPRGDYVWYNRQIVDWVNGPLPSAY